MKRVRVIALGVIVMGLSPVYSFLEERVYCQIVDGSLRVSLEERGEYCHTYQDRVLAAQDVARSLAEDASSLARSSTLEVDRQYRESVSEGYESQASTLGRFSDQITDAIHSYEQVVLIRVQGYLSRTMKLTTLSCQNRWKAFKAGYTSSRYPLCWLGQERQIHTLQTTDDLDEFAQTLQSYVARRQRIVGSRK